MFHHPKYWSAGRWRAVVSNWSSIGPLWLQVFIPTNTWSNKSTVSRHLSWLNKLSQVCSYLVGMKTCSHSGPSLDQFWDHWCREMTESFICLHLQASVSCLCVCVCVCVCVVPPSSPNWEFVFIKSLGWTLKCKSTPVVCVSGGSVGGGLGLTAANRPTLLSHQ